MQRSRDISLLINSVQVKVWFELFDVIYGFATTNISHLQFEMFNGIVEQIAGDNFDWKSSHLYCVFRSFHGKLTNQSLTILRNIIKSGFQ